MVRDKGVVEYVDAARRLADRDDIVFVICGEGPNQAALGEAAAGLGNVQLHPLQPADAMGDLLALADIHLLPQLPGAADLVLPPPAEGSAEVAARVAAVRAVQRERFRDEAARTNAEAEGELLERVATPDEAREILGLR